MTDDQTAAPEPAATPPPTPPPPESPPKESGDAGTLPPSRDDVLRRLRGDAADLSNVRSGQIISEVLASLTMIEGGISVGGDFIIGTSNSGSSKPATRRTTKRRLDPKLVADEAHRYVRPVGFDSGVDVLSDNNLAIFSGPKHTGRRSRALTSLVTVMQANGLDLEIYELTGNVLGNMAWRVPQARCGFIVVDEARKPAAESVDDKWLTYATDRLLEQQSYLVVTTGPVSGSLATAPRRAEFVLEELELPDPIEIVRRYVADESPLLSAVDIDELIDKTELADILDERDDPRFAIRAATTLTEALRANTDPAPAISRLRNPEEQVREWLGADPDATDIAFVFATATLEGSSYLKVADAAVALYRAISNGSAAMTPRYLRKLTAERTWIESAKRPDDPDGPPVVRFRHAGLRSAVLALTWFEFDGARDKILDWLTDLAEHTDVEVRARAAGSAGVLATTDFRHGLHRCFLPWSLARSATLRQSAALGLNVVGSVGRHAEAVWTQIEQWADLVHYKDKAKNLPATAALAAGGPLGTDDPRRALRVLRTLVCDGDWGLLEPAALSTQWLLEAGRANEVLDALMDWTESTSITPDESVVKALTMFAFAAGESGSTESGTTNRPALLQIAQSHRDTLPDLWARALACEPVRPMALEALEVWVRVVDKDPSTFRDVVEMVGGIADQGDQHYSRLCHALRQWAEDVDDPSDAAADIYNELVEAGELTA
jgi:hypothetical protein